MLRVFLGCTVDSVVAPRHAVHIAGFERLGTRAVLCLVGMHLGTTVFLVKRVAYDP